ncbi:MAG: cell division protein FtsW [Azospirillum sp.]|nr:cell division protein FtsW [Azospirillum sp.]MCA3265953.1 cell division protein FtsW [Azospirillum sp.]MCZ8122785.1 putative peptidoglycan glycosyltransferase FtsW [Magnetospirillum sp.]
MSFARADNSVIARWWWTVDKWMLTALALLIGTGAVLIMAASPAVATRVNLDTFHFVRKQLQMLPVAAIVLIGVSMLNPKQVRGLALFGFCCAIAFLVLTFFVGTEIKGAKRWISLPGFSLQPSEFLKPTFAVVAAWLFALARKKEGFAGDLYAILLYGLSMGLLLLQPDIGMAFVVSCVWFAQYFLAGLRMLWVAGLACVAGAAAVGLYFTFPHFESRVNRFLDPASGDTYQVNMAMEAFMNGGLMGRGPGEGTAKSYLPDAHSDFIFAVAAEEFGLILCLFVVALYAFVVLRGLARALQETDLFVVLAVGGLCVQFGVQALVNMGSTLHLIPTKGMTLPFVSYGGSSLLAIALGMGFVLALSRKRFGQGETL